MLYEFFMSIFDILDSCRIYTINNQECKIDFFSALFLQETKDTIEASVPSQEHHLFFLPLAHVLPLTNLTEFKPYCLWHWECQGVWNTRQGHLARCLVSLVLCLFNIETFLYTLQMSMCRVLRIWMLTTKIPSQSLRSQSLTARPSK